MSRLAPKLEVVRALFAFSGNQCAFPGCSQPLISDKGKFIGQICHIEAANKGGQRYNENQLEEERRAQDNLLLMCYPHHKETDDENEYPVEKLKEIKLNHENSKKNQGYYIEESVLVRAHKEIEQSIEYLIHLSNDTNSQVREANLKLDLLLDRISLKADGVGDALKQQLNSIIEIYRQRKYYTGLDLLLKFKEENWSNLTDELQYRVIAQLGIFYLDLNNKTKAIDSFLYLSQINFESTNRLTYLALGYALKGEDSLFDELFEQIRSQDDKSTNLWVAYIHRHRYTVNVEHILLSIPNDVLTTLQVASNVALLLIENRKWEEALDILNKAFSIHENEDDISEVKGIVGSKLMHMLVIPEKFMFNNYSDDELKFIRIANDMLSAAWEIVKDTELGKSRFYILMNRGTANRLLGNLDQTIFDLQGAYEISKEFLPFQALFAVLLQTKNISLAEHLLSSAEFDTPLTSEQECELALYRSRICIMKGDKNSAIFILKSELGKNNSDNRKLLLTEIITACVIDNQNELAESYCRQLIEIAPDSSLSYLLCGSLSENENIPDQALLHYNKAAQLLNNDTPLLVAIQLANRLRHFKQYDNAIAIYERFANKNVLSELTKGLIKCFFASGDLQAAYALAKNLNQNYPNEIYLVDVLSDIYQETKQSEKALGILEQYINSTIQISDDILLLKAARLALLLQQPKKAQDFALKITDTRTFSLQGMFIFATILVEVGSVSQGLDIALHARERFFDDSEAHSSFMTICINAKRSDNDVFPEIVRENCAVTLLNKAKETKVFIITEKNVRGQKLTMSEPLAKELLGLTIGAELMLQSAFGAKETVIVSEIRDLVTYAFQESLSLFKNRFAGQQPIGVFEFDKHNPQESMMEVLKVNKSKQTEFEDYVFTFYREGKATLGVLAGLFKRNIVEQWYCVVRSSDISFCAFMQDESVYVLNTVNNSSNIVVDVTALLTWFIVLKQEEFFPPIAGEYIVAQSTVDELQDYIKSIEDVASSGRLSVGLENGKVVSEFIPDDVFSANQKLIQKIIAHIENSAVVRIPKSLIEVNRNEREQKDRILGGCFYDTLLLAGEYNATVLSDDENFKRLVRHDGLLVAFSTYEMQNYLATIDKIGPDQLEQSRYDLIEANYTCIPSSADQIWMTYNNSEFKIAKPFTTAVQGLLVVTPEFAAICLAQVFKKIFLNSGLVVTRLQTVNYLLHQMTRRPDFNQVKLFLFVALEKEFLLLPQHKGEILNMVKAFK